MGRFIRIVATFALATLASVTFAQDKVGVLMLHGKNPGSARDPNFGFLQTRLEREGMLVELPDMPWSRNRYIDGDWDQAMREVAGHVKKLRERGATKIVLMGHSMGVPAALSHAARKGDVQGMVLLAPGHVPVGYYRNPAFSAVKNSVDEARAMVAAGKGDEKGSFNDINQGRAQSVRMSAKDYLTYFDPQSDADMSVTAPRVPAEVPSLVVVGDQDPIFRFARSYFADRLPANPKSQYLEVNGNHYSTPSVAADALVEWIKKL